MKKTIGGQLQHDETNEKNTVAHRNNACSEIQLRRSFMASIYKKREMKQEESVANSGLP